MCSSPTLVSTTTGAPSTLVASWRPPRPASTTATSTPRRASSANAAAVSSSNCVTRSPSSSVRSTLAAAAAARCTAAPKASAPRSASPIRIRSANEVRCGDRNVPVRTPCASSSAAVIRAVERLAVRADDVDRAEALLRAAEHGQQPAHALEPEAHAEQLEREQVGLGVLEAPGAHRSASSRLSSLELLALLLDHRGGRLGHEALVGELALGAGDLLLERRALRLGAPARGLEVDGLGGEHERRCRRGRRRWPPARRRRPTTRRARAARRARPCARSRRPPAARGRPCRPRRRRGRASRAAPAWPRSRAGRRPRRPRRAARRRARGSDGPSAGRRRRGCSDQISSVTNGITGCASASVSPSTCSASSATSRVVVRVQARLDHLQVPVAQLAVDEVVHAQRGVVELEARRSRRATSALAACRRERIQRSSTASAAGARSGIPTPSGTRSSTSREAFQSLLASWRPWATRSSLKRTSCVEELASRPAADGVGAVGGEVAALARTPAGAGRRRSGASGSMPVPSDFDIRRPSGAWIDRVHVDVVERDVARELEPEHDHAGDPEEEDVARRREDVGRIEGLQRRGLRPASRASRTATCRSRTRCRARRGRAPSRRPPAAPCRRRSRRRGTRPGSGGPTRAGARCTTAGCSPSTRGSAAAGPRGGSARGRTRTTSIAGSASSSIRMNHWSEISGSIRSPERCEYGTSWRYCSVRAIRPSSRSASTTASRASSAVMPSNSPGRRGHAPVLADHA